MLRARREARQGGQGGPYAQDPRYAQAGGRSRYRDRGQGYPQDQYGPPQDPYGHYPQQQYGPPQDQFGYQKQQYNQPEPYGQQYGPPQPQWPQKPSDPRQMYGPPQPYGEQPPPPAYSPNGPYPGNEVSVQQSQAYIPTQLPQLPPQEPDGPRPCVIPQLSHKRFSGENMSPFVRCRIPGLESQISAHELIVFIDELNEAFMANPALQTANNLANVAGMAPSMIAQIVGVGVNVAAGVGSSVTTKVRTKKYLAKANEEVFHPKGLHVQMCKTDKMLEYIGLGGQSNVFVRQQYKNAFEGAQQFQMDGPVSPYESSNHPVMQRMSSLGNRVMPLSFNNVETAATPDGFWKKWGAKEAGKAEQKQNEKIAKDQAREDRRSGRRAGRGSSRRQDRQDDKKAKETKKILWIVIAAKEESAGGDDEWDSGSETSESHGKH